MERDVDEYQAAEAELSQALERCGLPTDTPLDEVDRLAASLKSERLRTAYRRYAEAVRRLTE